MGFNKTPHSESRKRKQRSLFSCLSEKSQSASQSNALTKSHQVRFFSALFASDEIKSGLRSQQNHEGVLWDRKVPPWIQQTQVSAKNKLTHHVRITTFHLKMKSRFVKSLLIRTLSLHSVAQVCEERNCAHPTQAPSCFGSTQEVGVDIVTLNTATRMLTR